MNNGLELSGKVAIVTGGARNIGRAIGIELANAGAKVMVNANTSIKEAEETVCLIKAAGGVAAYFVADITCPESVKALVGEVIKRWGRIDLLVSNAATRQETALADITIEEWHRVLSVVLDGAFLCTQACVPHMKTVGGGSIVTIGGMTGHRGGRNRSHVITAKAGLVGFVKALATELAADQITVNCVVPGTIATQRGIVGAPLRPKERDHTPPLGRHGEPSEVAAMVRMLCGPGARYVTGQAIHINGGGWMP